MSEALAAIRPRGGRVGRPVLRLVVAPPSGAGPQYARPLLAPDVDLWGARYPGRETRRGESFAPRIEAIADELAGAVAEVHDADPLPLVLLGNSMGAGVVVELARRLERDRPGVLRGVVLAGREAPGRQEADELGELPELMRDDARLAAWVADLGGTPPELLADEAFLALLLPVLRADLLISLEHDALAGPVLTTDVVLACGDDDPVVDLAGMRGWSVVTRGHVSELALPGGHHGVVETPAPVLDVARRLVGAT